MHPVPLQRPSSAFIGASWAALLIGAITYLSEHRIRHHHHSTGAPMDASYAESNSQASYDRDRLAYARFVDDGQLAQDIAILADLRAGRGR